MRKLTGTLITAATWLLVLMFFFPIACARL